MSGKKRKTVDERYERIVKDYEGVFWQNLNELGDLFDNNDPDFWEILESVPNGFGGPSIYFHGEAIAKSKGNEFLKDEHLKMIYAVLPAWGMHRMTKTTKIVHFDQFKKVLQEDHRGLIDEFRLKLRKDSNYLENMNNEEIKQIVSLTKAIKVKAPSDEKEEDGTYLVSSSKTLHHILPDLVPPFDRAYSLKIMRRKASDFYKQPPHFSSDDEECYYRLFIEKMRKFIFKKNKQGKYHRYEAMRMRIEKHNKEKDFDTSVPKLFDNMIIAYVKLKQKYNPK